MARALAAAALIVCALTAARAQNFARPSQEYGNAQRYPIAWVPQLAADLPLAQADFDRRHAEGGISDSFSQVTGNLGAVVSAVDPGLVERLQAAGIATQAQLQAHIGQRQRQGAPREELEPLYRLDYAQEVLSSVLDGQRELLRPQSAAPELFAKREDPMDWRLLLEDWQLEKAATQTGYSPRTYKLTQGIMRGAQKRAVEALALAREMARRLEEGSGTETEVARFDEAAQEFFLAVHYKLPYLPPRSEAGEFLESTLQGRALADRHFRDGFGL